MRNYHFSPMHIYTGQLTLIWGVDRFSWKRLNKTLFGEKPIPSTKHKTRKGEPNRKKVKHRTSVRVQELRAVKLIRGGLA